MHAEHWAWRVSTVQVLQVVGREAGHMGKCCDYAGLLSPIGQGKPHREAKYIMNGMRMEEFSKTASLSMPLSQLQLNLLLSTHCTQRCWHPR